MYICASFDLLVKKGFIYLFINIWGNSFRRVSNSLRSSSSEGVYSRQDSALTHQPGTFITRFDCLLLDQNQKLWPEHSGAKIGRTRLNKLAEDVSLLKNKIAFLQRHSLENIVTVASWIRTASSPWYNLRFSLCFCVCVHVCVHTRAHKELVSLENLASCLTWVGNVEC